MSETKRTEIGTLGEFGLIDRLTQDWPLYHHNTLKGVGDDAAVLNDGVEAILVTTDMLIEGIHFDLAYHPLKHLGYKSIIVNLSDIYAMNGHAEQVFVSVGISNRFSVEAIEELYAGIRVACETYKVDLAGGDTCSSGKGLVISVTAIGRAAKDKIVYRKGATPGDLICVSGDLGAAYLGLQILEREKQLFIAHPKIQPDLEGQDYLIGRQLKPEARKDMIEIFAQYQLLPTAMIDISDGLSSDLMHICKQSGTGARLDEAQIPIREDAELMALKFQMDPTTCALSGGEDYELLFTARPDDLEKLRVMPGVYLIGEIVAKDQGIMLQTSGGQLHRLTAQGWTHF
ncbi:MAG TPA: thiamine-phosphate kinase [Saprospiraceae bacterium]|nr:thiamine-phosphate kinase [Saprospiraceae bacterium]